MGSALSGNAITLLESGGQYFPALLEAIRHAQREILLETYLFACDEIGVAVADALREAAVRGVCVRVMVDGFGAGNFVHDFMPDLAAEGVEILVFRREMKAFSLGRHRLRRLHRKLVLVDGRIGFIGGINIIDDYDAGGSVFPRVDFVARVEGPLVVRMHVAMVRLWRLVLWASFKRRLKTLEWVRPERKRVGDISAEFLIRDNFRHRRDIESAYLEQIRQARSHILIASAYFFPGYAFRRALVEAAQRGVMVTLLLQGKVEYWLLHHASQVLYRHLQAAGIQIVEYRKGFLHAKVAVVDKDWATVGSSNIDPFSFLLAREANIVVRSAAFTKVLHERLERIMAEGGVALSPLFWQGQPLWKRSLDWLAYGLVRAAIGVLGYGRRHSG